MFNIKIDSKKINKGDTFVAIRGSNVDGHNFILDAIKNGATKVIAEYGDYPVETIYTDNTTKYIRSYLEETYKDIISKMKFIGVTGTNGKTSTSYLIYQILNELGENSAYIGTIGYHSKYEKIELNNTTPTIVELYELIIKTYEAGIYTIVMEVSSHALDMNRCAGINFDVSGFTNFTEDHLDYHKTMENYLEAKKKIVNKTKKMVVNIDDEYGKVFCTNLFDKVGFKNADILIKKYNFDFGKTKIHFSYKDKDYFVETNLMGKFNVYNYMLALGICLNYKSIEDIIKVTPKINAPVGRCELIKFKDSLIVIDYAHTPDAVEKIINVFKETKKKIITIIGCGGNRDPFKRPIMGRVATSLSDFVIFTNDNPRNENEAKIMEDITKNLKNTNYEIIYDRKDAIKNGISLLKNDDILLVLGKGHEDYQIIGATKYHLSDKEEILKNIK